MDNPNDDEFAKQIGKALDILKSKDAQMPAFALGERLEWRKISCEIPYIQFPRTWKIKMVPPFSGATTRFFVTKEGMGDSFVSVYLDYHNSLGFEGEPYWEIYDYKDTERYLINDTDELLKGIDRALKRILRRIKKIY